MSLSGANNTKIGYSLMKAHSTMYDTCYSEQQLVDCIGFFKGRGCSGGWTEAAYDYLISSPFGSQTSAGYPYDFPLTSSFGLVCIEESFQHWN